MTRFYLAFIATLITFSAYSENFAVITGGNGESDYKHNTSTNIFRMPFIQLENDLETAGWKTSILYDTYPNLFRGDANNSSKVNLINKLNEILKKENHKKPKDRREDQLLLWIDTHGGKDCFMVDEKVCLNYDDPDLNKVLAELKQSGIKLAFINEACESGSQQKTFTKYGCALSSQSESYDDYGDPFNDLLHTLVNQPQRNTNLSMNDFYSKALGAFPLEVPQINEFDDARELSEKFYSTLNYAPKALARSYYGVQEGQVCVSDDVISKMITDLEEKIKTYSQALGPTTADEMIAINKYSAELEAMKKNIIIQNNQIEELMTEYQDNNRRYNGRSGLDLKKFGFNDENSSNILLSSQLFYNLTNAIQKTSVKKKDEWGFVKLSLTDINFDTRKIVLNEKQQAEYIDRVLKNFLAECTKMGTASNAKELIENQAFKAALAGQLKLDLARAAELNETQDKIRKQMSTISASMKSSLKKVEDHYETKGVKAVKAMDGLLKKKFDQMTNKNSDCAKFKIIPK